MRQKWHMNAHSSSAAVKELIISKSYYPDVKRIGDWELTFESDDSMEVMKAFHRMD